MLTGEGAILILNHLNNFVRIDVWRSSNQSRILKFGNTSGQTGFIVCSRSRVGKCNSCHL